MIKIGDLKSLRLLWTYLATNHRYGELISTEDVQSFNDRAHNEGLTFMTISLPSLGRALDEFHATMVWNPPLAFEANSEGIPHFMSKAVKLALEGDSLAVDCVRQLSYVFYKLEVDYDKALVDDFLAQFIITDKNLVSAYSSSSLSREQAAHVERMRALISQVLYRTDPWDIRPSHGSGSTACRTRNSDKWHFLRYFPKLDATYNYADYFFYSYTHLADEYDRLENSTESSPCARIVIVPKDSRGPRIISCEPAELMYIQQGLMKLMYRVIETNYLTRGQINFADQEVNRNLAKIGSTNGSYSTLDLSEASDRVSLQLVQDIFPPAWVECLEACRSESTELPSREIIKLNKFAPMGSSCCFPVEALVFWASCQATYIRLGVKAESYVYGDDIILPGSNTVKDVIFDLELIGLKVNQNKSFAQGPFRESCGGDYHFGNDVSPVRVRKFPGSSNTSIATSADLINNLIVKFGYEDVLPIIELIEGQEDYVYPRTELDIPCTVRHAPVDLSPVRELVPLNLGEPFGIQFYRRKASESVSSNDAYFKRRWNKPLQRWEHRVLQLFTGALALREPTWCELLRKELTDVPHSNTAGNTSGDETPESMEPGMYAVVHSARNRWTWIWLG